MAPSIGGFAMKNRLWMSLLLGAALTVPALAQQSSSTSDQSQPANQQPAATPSNQAPVAQPAQSSDQNSGYQSTSSTQTASNDQAESGSHTPLVVDKHQGFWGKLNPFARKKYIQRQMAPVRDRVNELDELTASNAKSIRDVDSRATEGIRLASVKANEADQHAIDAGNRAQAATQTAQQANTRLTNVEQVVTNIDQYKPATQTELRFRSGQTVLSKRAKEALDEMATPLKSQRGYIIEVQGFASGRGQSAIQSSQRMAESVVRYLVLNHDIPVYRIYLLGMGNAPVSASAEGEKPRRTSGGRVEISLLKNSLEQLSSNTGAQAAPANSSQPAADQQQQQQQ
jgi:outer membrane protein OmpA-like peptidoglycan-associated protein